MEKIKERFIEVNKIAKNQYLQNIKLDLEGNNFEDLLKFDNFFIFPDYIHVHTLNLNLSNCSLNIRAIEKHVFF